MLTALRVGRAIARFAQIYTILLSEIAGKLPTAGARLPAREQSSMQQGVIRGQKVHHNMSHF
ncbi:MAG: hypothetical protein DME32_13940 [Verrucomicrobia bacterium]|nr:MAG: hypothetical protein DME32_13940 [Verrucomicrobiota bacterium]